MGFPLQQLRDIHEAPLPAGTLPGGELWLLLASLGLCGLLLLWLGLRLYRRRAWWQHYLCWRRLRRDEQASALAINQFLKSLLLCYQPRAQIAGLSAQAWLNHLDSLGQTRFCQFAPHWESWLYGGQALSAAERDALLSQCHHLLLALRRQIPC
ncbi:DUF4381 domain-containing protein [Pseudaeromonas sp. ZJS20]|uniref:DUF4381 domain-containing protein n=1 Tax=Pseudaeromonas aegiceratis TaxID=3153928 RepID=UPI00390C8C59